MDFPKELAEGHLIWSTCSPRESFKDLWGKTENNKLVRNEENGDNELLSSLEHGGGEC